MNEHLTTMSNPPAWTDAFGKRHPVQNVRAVGDSVWGDIRIGGGGLYQVVRLRKRDPKEVVSTYFHDLQNGTELKFTILVDRTLVVNVLRADGTGFEGAFDYYVWDCLQMFMQFCQNEAFEGQNSKRAMARNPRYAQIPGKATNG